MDGRTRIDSITNMPTITPHHTGRKDYCVGDRIGFSLSGLPLFTVEYQWNGRMMKSKNQISQYVHITEKPGNFTITGLQDSASICKASLVWTSIVHPIPSVRINGGSTIVKGILAGD